MSEATPPLRPSPLSNLGRGFFNWLSLLSGLIRRDMQTRYAGGALGYAWAIIIPAAWILAITSFFHWIGRSSPIGTDLPIFVATGMMPYLAFRQAITSMNRGIRAERHLLVFGPARPEDLFTATAIAEALNTLLVVACILSLLAATSLVPAPGNALQAIFGLSLAWALGVSTGRIAALLSLLSDTARRLLPIILRPFFWVSGIFFVAAELPTQIAGWLWWNPLLHITEILRSGYFAGFESTMANPLVPLIAIGAMYFGSRALEFLPITGEDGLARA